MRYSVNVTRTTGIEAALTTERHQTKRGGPWQGATQVARLLRRAEAQDEPHEHV
jgi:hypothetical protein